MFRTVDLVSESFTSGQRLLEQRAISTRKTYGQFLTSPPVARYMAGQLGDLPPACSILDPSLGSGVLLCAVIERLMERGAPAQVELHAYEIDPVLFRTAEAILERACRLAAERSVNIVLRLHQEDFVTAALEVLQPSLFSRPTISPRTVDRIIANPPYFKLQSDDPRVTTSRDLIGAHTNIYTLFMALATRQLARDARGVFIIPRSFCSGAYFAPFRDSFADQVEFERLHLFGSRDQNFDEVLQENVILTFKKRDDAQPGREMIAISTSKNGADLDDSQVSDFPSALVVHRRARHLFYRLPVSEEDAVILRAFDTWTGSLHQYGMEVSTGRVVAFRAVEHMMSHQDSDGFPLLWMHHVKSGSVLHPLPRLNKPQWLRASALSASLVVPSANYVLLRRFSAKEEPRRLVAGSFLSAEFPGVAYVGFENHLNYVYRLGGVLSAAETLGLTSLFNSALYDRYFRITNGNTQVNAAELRALPLPPLDIIRRIGEAGLARPSEDIDHLVFSHLSASGHIALGLTPTP
ncbi:MAG: Eco57I restriction-modification methylase domain-containing protein [Anaerolineae bacterium]|nr:Eco57I restriction-modification methylase domain-containing protein [Anaerolineae bacterium]